MATNRPRDNELDGNHATRRRLMKAGLVAAPFILTLKATPLRAGSGSLGVYDYDGGGGGTGQGQGQGRVKKNKKGSFN